MKSYTAIERTYYIAHNGNDVMHYGIIEVNQTVSTGQTELETFDNKENWEARLLELGVELETDIEIDN